MSLSLSPQYKGTLTVSWQWVGKTSRIRFVPGEGTRHHYLLRHFINHLQYTVHLAYLGIG